MSSLNNDLFVFGGIAGNSIIHFNIKFLIDGELTSNELYVTKNILYDQPCNWTIIQTKGYSPECRYGHCMVYYNGCIILFGGHSNKFLNDVWIINIENLQIECCWNKIIINQNNPAPCPRMYHAFAICTEGSSNGLIVTFGGRGKDNLSLNDLWGLRRHRNDQWDWVR